MGHLSRIFLAADFSSGARTALSVARSLAKVSEATVEIVHVLPPIPRAMRAVLFPYAGLGSDETTVTSELRDQTERAITRYLRLDRDSEERVKLASHSLTVRPTRETPIADVLAEALAESDAELVLVGATGETGQRPGILGGQVERLVTGATRPVFIARDAEGPRSIQRIAVALDLSRSSQAVYEAAIDLALLVDADLDIVTVVPNPTKDDVGGVVASSVKTDKKGLRERGVRELSKTLARLRDEGTTRYSELAKREALAEKERVFVGDPATELLRFLGDSDVQLLVVGRRGSGVRALPLRLGRTARAVASTAPCHVLVVP